MNNNLTPILILRIPVQLYSPGEGAAALFHQQGASAGACIGPKHLSPRFRGEHCHLSLLRYCLMLFCCRQWTKWEVVIHGPHSAASQSALSSRILRYQQWPMLV